MHFMILELGESPGGILAAVHANKGTTSGRDEIDGHDVSIFPKCVTQLLLVHQLKYR